MKIVIINFTALMGQQHCSCFLEQVKIFTLCTNWAHSPGTLYKLGTSALHPVQTGNIRLPLWTNEER